MSESEVKDYTHKTELEDYTHEINILEEKEVKNKNMTFIQFLQIEYNNIFKDFKNKSTWLFKGHSSSEWPLKTDFERAVEKYYRKTCEANINDYDAKSDENRHQIRFYIEQDIIREFKRKSPNLLEKIPEQENILEWLSLMRHHGAPCRLLDFTYSFYVALYFAVEKMEFYDHIKRKETDNDACAVFGINSELFKICKLWNYIEKNMSKDLIKKLKEVYKSGWKIKLKNALEKASKDSDKIVKEFIFTPKSKGQHNTRSNELCVFNISPYILNERIIIQQGTFLCPWDIGESFEKNLVGNIKASVLPINRTKKASDSGLEQEAKELGKKFIKKIVIKITKEERRKIILELNRMNINRASLFPGLDGFASSLGIRMEMTK